VTKGRVSKVMGHTRCLNQVSVCTNAISHSAANLGRFKRMSKSSPEEVAFVRSDDLGLAL
jgi:hypothetical protein